MLSRNQAIELCQTKSNKTFAGYHVVENGGVYAVKRHRDLFKNRRAMVGKIIFSTLPCVKNISSEEFELIAARTA